MKTVPQRAAEVAEVARSAAGWLQANRASLKEDPLTLAREFRKFARRTANLRVAAKRTMCVAVFGASQAGKSYLVSSLATRPGQPLMAVYGDRQLNFLLDLNPEGGKESTGLVSRFTVRGVTAPPQAPVPVRLMSQTDIVKILANAYLADFKVHDTREPEARRDCGPVCRTIAKGGRRKAASPSMISRSCRNISPSTLPTTRCCERWASRPIGRRPPT